MPRQERDQRCENNEAQGGARADQIPPPRENVVDSTLLDAPNSKCRSGCRAQMELDYLIQAGALASEGFSPGSSGEELRHPRCRERRLPAVAAKPRHRRKQPSLGDCQWPRHPKYASPGPERIRPTLRPRLSAVRTRSHVCEVPGTTCPRRDSKQTPRERKTNALGDFQRKPSTALRFISAPLAGAPSARPRAALQPG